MRRPTTKGYSIIGLVTPKTPANVGSIMRACGVYGATHCFFTGKRFARAKQFITDPQKFYRRIPLTNVEDLQAVIPFDCVPVAVDLITNAEPLPTYTHPDRAFYIFGPEDGTLDQKTLSFCQDTIFIPGNGCMNLAATVNVVLYDRLAKEIIKKQLVIQSIDDPFLP